VSATTEPRPAGRFPFVEVSGSPRERGRQHGEACRWQVQQYAATLLRALRGEAALRSVAVQEGPSLGAEDLSARALTFLPAFEAHAPHLVDEIRGIAEGADVPFAAALLVNVRAEVAALSHLPAAAGTAQRAEASVLGLACIAQASQAGEGCTAFAVGRDATTGVSVILGQNQDQDPVMEELGIVLRVRPDVGPPMVMATFGGLVGYPGLNAAGVAQFQNALSNGVWRHALPHYPVKRMLYERRTVGDAIRVFETVQVASCANYLLGDSTGRLVDLEVTPCGYARVGPRDGILVHTNHFRSTRFRSQERLLQSLPDSQHRLDRMTALLRASSGRITLDTVQAALRDHDGRPASICRHEPHRPVKTIASIIAEPDQGRLHVARGNPCENDNVAYSVE
jgi:isopenicillin-N N-acyltransferase-like protein